jgi:hypothetical protein
VETFTRARPLVPSPSYDADRKDALEGLRIELSKGSIDGPTVDVIESFSRLPHCYTLQSCYGHFMRRFQAEDKSIHRVGDMGIRSGDLHYRIAYVALCAQNSDRGRMLLEEMRAVQNIDPDYIQFGSADWFWERCVNSYVLQVSPIRNACQDHFEVSLEEARRIERARDMFFEEMLMVLAREEAQGVP